MTIDWNAPIEAVHTDGRVVPVELDDGPDSDGEYKLTTPLEKNYRALYFRADGSQAYTLKNRTRPWSIRNRKPEDTVTVRSLTREQIEAEYVAYLDDDKAGDVLMFFAKRWGILRKETPADRFKEAYPNWNLMPRDELVAAALEFTPAKR